MRIAISSRSGCGNTTVTRMLSERLGYPMINFTFRQMAEERGMEFWDFCRLAESDDDIDRELDRRQVEMALSVPDCVLGSRLAIWMLREADLKVYLTASAETRARRILKREGGSFEERYRQTVERDSHDSARYMRIYGIDNTSAEETADLVIATDERSPEEIVSIIEEAVRARIGGVLT